MAPPFTIVIFEPKASEHTAHAQIHDAEGCSNPTNQETERKNWEGRRADRSVDVSHERERECVCVGKAAAGFLSWGF